MRSAFWLAVCIAEYTPRAQRRHCVPQRPFCRQRSVIFVTFARLFFAFPERHSHATRLPEPSLVSRERDFAPIYRYARH